ncbi:Neuroguidin [Trametes pubescens]|uniref:Neuroguidin n=1 Tax=Trametes pubescens TaxID=154538 RepID=A0A1M2VXF3_TRAPU|nr:Neuroguidin [Trametes pubescens]
MSAEVTATLASASGLDGGISDENVRAFCELLDQMRVSMASTRDTVKALREKQSATSELDTRDGISLLSLKHHMMLSYLQSLSLITARRAIGHSLADRSPPNAPFSAKDRPARGAGAADRVDATIEARVVLEKVKVLEGRMKYQIDKLVRIAEEGDSADKNITNDPLAFRPNPQALMDQGSEDEDEDGAGAHGGQRDGVYRPPKLAPMPYIESRKNKEKDRSRRAPVPSALANLAHLDPSAPHAESTSGLGGVPALASGRARELQRMNEFEEENFTRLVMKKKESRRRALDEADLALGGSGMASGRRGRVPGVGLEDEFGDILKSVGRTRSGALGDGYEELRQRGKKEGVLARSRARSGEDAFEDMGEDGPRQRKRSRFEKEVKAVKKRTSAKSKR